MYYKEVGDKFDLAIKQFSAHLSLADMEKAMFIADAQAWLQEQTGLIRYLDAVTIPAQTTLTPTPTSFRWHHVVSGRDNTNNIEYERRDYEQFMYSIQNWQNVPGMNSPWRIIQSTVPAPPYPNGDPANYIFTEEDHNMYVWPLPSADLVLTIHYEPRLPIMSADDAYWTDWYSSDASFTTQYTTTAIYREFLPYWRAIMEYMIWQWLEGFTTDLPSQKRALLAASRVADFVRVMKASKPRNARMVQAMAHPWG